MIIASTRNTTRCRWPTARRTGSPVRPIRCSAKPTSSATSRVWSTSPEVSEENIEVGMMPSRNSVVPLVAPSAWARPAVATASSTSSPEPGWSRLPTTRPMVSATVDIARK